MTHVVSKLYFDMHRQLTAHYFRMFQPKIRCENIFDGTNKEISMQYIEEPHIVIINVDPNAHSVLSRDFHIEIRPFGKRMEKINRDMRLSR